MSSTADKLAPVARIYAESLLALAVETGREDEVLEELDGLVAALDADPRLEEFLSSPLVNNPAKRQVLERALRGRASDLVVDALQVMRRKGRLGALRGLALGYRALWMVRKGRIEVRVASAVPLTETLRAELVRAAARRTGREPVLVETVKPSLLGGLVISIGDDKFDGSVATGVARLGESLLARASVELLSEKSYVTNSE